MRLMIGQFIGLVNNMSRISSISPFIEQRREKDRTNSIVYINYEDYPRWASINNYLITGSRGTGKSSVLTSFDYRIRWFNNKAVVYCEDYKDLAYDDIKNDRIIGILFKADRVETDMWNNWYQKDPNHGSLLFSSYINYYFASKILESTKKILSVFYPESLTMLSKMSLLKALFNLCDPGWSRKYSLLYDFSIEGLITFLEERRLMIRQTIYSGCSFSEVSGCMHSASSGFISNFCTVIRDEIMPLNNKLFFLMIDDVDRFKMWQIRCMNSFIKVTTEPCAWKLSSSLPYQTLATEDDARISGTDLKISTLNDENVLGKAQKKERIDELYDAIFKSRLKESGYNCSHMTSVQELFGKMDLEKSLKDIIDRSLNPILKEEYNAFLDSSDKYYSDYWLKKNGILKECDSRKKFDKYRVNAVFAIVREYGLEESFRYSSYEVIRALCSGSPRHFLRICDSMWMSIAEKLKAVSLKKKEINKDDQNRAIRNASNELINVIDNDKFSKSIDVSCYDMCDKLSKLFILLTNDKNSLRRSQECMSVSINLADIRATEMQDNMLKIIDKLTMLEVIKVRVDQSVSTIYQIGLNPMLSPCYCISFRNPFMNSLEVNAEDFYAYITGTGTVTTHMLAGKRIAFYGPTLFSELGDE